MSARLLALEALKAMQAEASARNCGLRICDEAIVALLAETGEPVAWRIWSPDGANVYQYTEDGDGEPLYTAPPPAVQEPYAWTVSGTRRMWFGKYAENDARIEAKHCGGSCEAYPLYRWAP